MSKVWNPHLLIAWGGTMGSPGLDVWTNTLKAIVQESDGVTLTSLTEEEQGLWLDDAQAVISTFFTSGTTYKVYGSAVYLNWAKANMIGADGKYVYPVTTVHDYSTPPNNTGAGSPDWRQSIAITLRTGLQRGPARVGRFYPAQTPGGCESAGSPYIATANATAIKTAAQTLVNSLNTITVTDSPLPSGKIVTISCVSAGETAVGVEPSFNYVTSVEVDRVFDTQRRRTNRVPRSIV